jgi:hypothetical protein
MKPNGRDYETDPVLKRLVNLDHATLILARSLQARGPHTEGGQILDVHDEDDGDNWGPISDVSASQTEADDTEAVPARYTDPGPPSTKEQLESTATPAFGRHLCCIVSDHMDQQCRVSQAGDHQGRLRMRFKHHTPSFLLERLVWASPHSWNSSPMSLSATALINTTSTSSIVPMSKSVLVTRVRQLCRFYEFVSKSGIVVSASVLNLVNNHN